MSYANLTGTNIRRAAVRGVRLDGIAAQRSTERLLAQIPDAIPGMSASSILCVREMSIHVRSKPHHMHSASSMLGGEMERLARQAARPAHGPVPPHAESVLFDDRAELLGCLARDHVRHLLEQSWWWSVLLPGSNLAAAAMQLWVSEAAHVPAALARLAQSQDAVAFVRKLGDTEAMAVVKAMVRAHGLALLAENSTVATQLQSHSHLNFPAFSKSQHVDAQVLTSALAAKIRTLLPEAWIPGLSVTQRRLLALGLSLERMPNLVRSAAYAQALPVLLEQVTRQATNEERSGGTANRENPLQASPDLSSSRNLKKTTIPSLASGRVPGRGLPVTGISNRLDADPTFDLPADMQCSQDEILPTTKSSPTPLHLPPTDILAPATQAIAMRNDAGLQVKAQMLATEYGGVFFLCNAALALDLYSDFTRPLDRGLELSFWDFLALAAVDLGGPSVRHDPLWPLLAELAGRSPGQRPGTGFVPPCEWRLPSDWLLPFAGDTADWTWEADAARLVVRHPAGFVVLDLLRTEMSAEEQLCAELARYEVGNFRQVARRRRYPVTPLARWRSWVMPYLGRRVARALGDERWRRACRQLLILPGQIECNTERLEVHYSLEQLPVMVRIAGLDRDPGWVPAAGRDLRFYFGCDHA